MIIGVHSILTFVKQRKRIWWRSSGYHLKVIILIYALRTCIFLHKIMYLKVIVMTIYNFKAAISVFDKVHCIPSFSYAQSMVAEMQME
jgi:hypothetical protein